MDPCIKSTVGNKKTGFTLVELAIAMVIIGLIVGGILKGAEMVDNARIKTTAAQMESYKGAVTVFRDKYNALPGDFKDAATRIGGCTSDCTPAATWAGDGIVGKLDWGSTDNWAEQLPAGGMNLPPSTEGDETQLFWIHLLKAGLISGISDEALFTPTTPQWGVTHPSAKIGGGFVVGQGDGASFNMGQTMAGVNGLSGLMLQLWARPNISVVYASPVCGAAGGASCSLTAAQAAKIDRKLDNGSPISGSVQAVAGNFMSKCVSSTGTPAYLETGSAFLKGSAVDYKVCDLAFSLN